MGAKSPEARENFFKEGWNRFMEDYKSDPDKTVMPLTVTVLEFYTERGLVFPLCWTALITFGADAASFPVRYMGYTAAALRERRQQSA